MKKLSLLLVFCSIQYIQAQTIPSKSKILAETLAGSGNYGVGASYSIDKINAVEGILSMNPAQQKYLFTGLFEQFYRVRKSNSLRWYAGLGMHIGFIRHKELHTQLEDVNKTDGLQRS